jgi:hypothetical protein
MAAPFFPSRALAIAPALMLAVACAEMAPAASPFRPVAVAAAPASASAEDAWFDTAPAVTVSSEEFAVAATAAAPGTASAAAAGALTGTGAPPAAPPAAAPGVAAAPVAPPAALVAPAAPAVPPAPALATGLSQWPVRLVRTLPDTQPPRAILGLPSGQELVVSPGSMVPDHGLVVMAVGRDSVQLAKVDAKGDSAAVSMVTLAALY